MKKNDPTLDESTLNTWFTGHIFLVISISEWAHNGLIFSKK